MSSVNHTNIDHTVMAKKLNLNLRNDPDYACAQN